MDTPLSFLLAAFLNLVRKSPAARPELPEDWKSELSRTDWDQRDVLVGSLRSKQQLEVCLRHRFYHIPVVQLTQEDFPIHYVAVYQSRTLFGENCGIFHYGRVTACSRVRRRDIRELPKDSDERYYRFEIAQWQTLPAPILPKETGFTCLLTNYFLLRHSREIPELTLRSERDFRFYQALRAALEERRPTPFFFDGCHVTFEKKTIRLYREDKLTAACLISDFQQTPKAALTRLVSGL